MPRSWSACAVFASVLLGIAPPSAAADRGATIRLAVLGAPVEIVYDTYDIPHIYGRSVGDIYRALGYVHASERLWQMEILRRRASGTLAELLGSDQLESDKLVRKLGIRRTAEEALRSGIDGPDVPRWLAAYSEGVNARLAELRSAGLPDDFTKRGIVPAPWQPTDSAAFMKYMGWDQSGTDADLWLGMMTGALGADAVAELWPLDRPYEVSTIPAEGATAKAPVISADVRALPSLGRHGLDARESLELMRRLAAAAENASGPAFGSNNWVISGARSTTGKPILANDPHLGLTIPSLWYTVHLVAPGLNVTGVTFPGQPFVTLGHNDRIAWGFTNLQSDAVDYFIETPDPKDPNKYLHRRESKPFAERKETIRVRGAAPVELTIRSTVHGPVEQVGDKLVALAWTGLEPTREARAISGLNRALGLDDFLTAMSFLDTPPLNVVYADVDGNIAMVPWGNLPLRARGLGRVPVDGASGEYDWVGLIPRSELPISINPPRGYLASANGRPTPAGYPHYLGWMWDASYRTRRINDLLAGARKLSFADFQRFQFDAHDKAAEVFTPVLLGALHGQKASREEEAALAALRGWDFVCTPDSIAPTVFARWFERYRKAVWQDEWTTRGIEQPEGSWGFSGDNQREPALEVLEYLTRESPQSIWFDDRTTPQRETRDDVLRSSFRTAVADLVERLGRDPKRWTWGPRNRLELQALSEEPAFARGGQELHGGPFTLNPGGNGDHVSGGASWRQLVDLGDLGTSIGVYPGGQSGDPASPHYDDQIPLWASGRYAPLWFHDAPGQVRP